MRLAGRWSWKGRQPPCGEEPDHMLGRGLYPADTGPPRTLSRIVTGSDYGLEGRFLWDSGGGTE